MDLMDKIENWDELVLPFQLDDANIRGRIARLDSVLEDVLRQHDYPMEVASLVAEAATLTALIGQTIKLRWKLSLQIRGDGPIRIIATDYYGPSAEGEPAKIRAYASFDQDRLDETNATPFEKIGSGMFAVLIDQGADMAPFQGITPLTGGSLTKCAETYFAQSEQLPTRFEITVGQSTTADEGNAWRAGGVMVQHIPDASPLMAKPDEDSSGQDGLTSATDLLDDDASDNWNRINILLDTVEETELVGPLVSPPTLLHRLFHEEKPRVFDPQRVKFGCTCGEDKVVQAMSIYSAKDIKTMTTDDGLVTADCQFCGAHYELDPETLGFEATKK
ncbi:33 kDa chaperonin [Amylibacter ulvae]|uniref:33 kDa chaperonin n=1 Tax=Paramylibacter ulvae TaxID=1651968 RepID=A0ABQ3CXZ4_9RHOB|nr:Hsp33 family molecular chaperone HslO [Amylibacter ulvae]GHA49153.1 33 kDa chaperonin [Amylibacter ulvae]